MYAKQIAVLLALCVFSCQATYIWQRCGACNYGSCSYRDVSDDVCTEFCNPCSSLCNQVYYNSTSQQLTFFRDVNCSDALISYQLQCDYCNVYDTSTCSNYYLNCSSTWWLWTGLVLLVLCIMGCCAIAIAGFAFEFYRRRNYMNMEYSTIEEPDYRQDPSAGLPSQPLSNSQTVVYQYVPSPSNSSSNMNSGAPIYTPNTTVNSSRVSSSSSDE